MSGTARVGPSAAIERRSAFGLFARDGTSRWSELAALLARFGSSPHRDTDWATKLRFHPYEVMRCACSALYAVVGPSALRGRRRKAKQTLRQDYKVA